MSDENLTIRPEDIQPLNTPTLKITYDSRNQVILVSYHKELNAENTIMMYQWLFSSIEKRGLLGVRGVIYDFTDVQKFTPSNLISTQRGSMAINAKVDLSRIPVAMLVKTIMQEQQVSIAMNITPGEQRKRIVKSMSQALTFINDFHKNLAQNEG
ncbi:MAG: hypothetical protein CUN52_09280 [Phototrophicales bacterium]|nr:MAG: hypothetical protein CUN52_09280 [Phototrophicales bacterium]